MPPAVIPTVQLVRNLGHVMFHKLQYITDQADWQLCVCTNTPLLSWLTHLKCVPDKMPYYIVNWKLHVRDVSEHSRLSIPPIHPDGNVHNTVGRFLDRSVTLAPGSRPTNTTKYQQCRNLSCWKWHHELVAKTHGKHLFCSISSGPTQKRRFSQTPTDTVATRQTNPACASVPRDEYGDSAQTDTCSTDCKVRLNKIVSATRHCRSDTCLEQLDDCEWKPLNKQVLNSDNLQRIAC